MAMTRRAFVRLTAIIAGVFGLAAAILLFLHHHPEAILALVGMAGFGLLWLVPVRVAVLALNAEGWRALLPGERQATLPLLTAAAFVRNAVNTLLPVAHVGGEVVATRLLARRGLPMPMTIASVVVETTVTLFVQIVLLVVGLGLLASYAGSGPLARHLWWGLVVAIPIVLAFVFVQRRSRPFLRLQRLAARVAGASFVAGLDGEAIDRAIAHLYDRPREWVRCAVWQMASALGGAGEFWVILKLLHQPAGLRLCVVLESLIQALQSAAFLVPGALGVQEGGLVGIGAVAGLAPEVALAVSLVRRIRQVGISLPVLWLGMRAAAGDGDHGDRIAKTG